MKKSEIFEMVKDLQAELEGVEEELRMEISKLRVELEEVKRIVEGLKNARHFNPLERIGPTLPHPYVWTERDMKDIWDQIEEEMKKHGVYIGDWPDPSKTTCTTIKCDKDENNPTQSK